MLRTLPYSFVLTLLAMTPLTSYAMGLDEVYQKAVVQSEILQSSQLDVGISQAERDRALTTQKPRIGLAADGTYQLDKLDKRNWGNGFATGVRTELRQPLYDGGVSRAAIQAGDASITASKWDYKVNEQDLYLQIAGLFYDYIAQSKDLINLEDTMKLYTRRVKDLGERERIGRSRDAEVLSARTQLELTKSLIATTKTNIGAAEEQIIWLTGIQPPLQLSDDLKLSDLHPQALPKQQPILPSVEAAQARIDVATATIDLTRAALNPQFDFIAAHDWRYLDASEQGSHSFSFGLGLTWTLYDAGAVNLAVTSASYSRSKALLAKQLADREGGLNLTLAKRKLVDNLEQIKAYESALDVVERTMRAQQQEFDSGLITNLELLTTLDQRLSIRRNLDLAIYRAKLVYVQSQVYGGKLINAVEKIQ